MIEGAAVDELELSAQGHALGDAADADALVVHQVAQVVGGGLTFDGGARRQEMDLGMSWVWGRTSLRV